jgi:hypothetical protein
VKKGPKTNVHWAEAYIENDEIVIRVPVSVLPGALKQNPRDDSYSSCTINSANVDPTKTPASWWHAYDGSGLLRASHGPQYSITSRTDFSRLRVAARVFAGYPPAPVSSLSMRRFKIKAE